MAIESKVEKITPKIAAEMLTHNSRNPRKTMSRAVIQKYADDMKAGLWTLNGEPIVFDEDGYLMNGQHRLCGAIKANTSFETLVVRGVARGITNFDGQYRRTISQNINGDGNFDVNQSIVAAAGIIVNNFGRTVGSGIIENYVRNNISELDRAYRLVCYGGTGYQKSRCAPCIAAGYMAIRTDRIPSYEIELFFRSFNEKNPKENTGYDISPARTAKRMFEEYGTGRSGYQIQKEKLEIIVMALEDFHNKVHREESYMIAEPFHFSEWIGDVRRKDGLEK